MTASPIAVLSAERDLAVLLPVSEMTGADMATVPHEEVRVTLGVDTHEDVHVGVALDQLGRRLGKLPISTDPVGFARLVDWAPTYGVVDRIGVEGTGSYGAGLSRWLRSQGLVVVEVDRPDRKTRRHGKSDTIDAEAAARAVQSGTGNRGAKDRRRAGGDDPHAARDQAFRG